MADAAVASASRRPGRGRIPGAAWMLAALTLVFALSAAEFLSVANLVNVGLQSALLLMLALPMTLIIMTEGLDLSMGAVLTLCGVVLAAVVVKHGSLPVALACALVTGAVFGIANGVLVANLRIPPFVATLGTMGVAQGLALVVTDGQSIVGVGEAVQSAYSGRIAGVPIPFLMAAASYLVLHVLLYHTRFGACIFALGGNREALTLAGIRSGAYLVGVYVLGGIMAGFAALLLTARMSAGHPTAAIGMEFDAIAAVAVGGTSFERGNGWLFGTLLGVLAVGVLRNGLNLLAISSSVQVAAIGLLVIVALLIDTFKAKP